MAARPAGANPPALKIKLKPRREPLPVSNAGSASQQPSSGQQTALQQPNSSHQKSDEDGKSRTLDGEVSRAGMLKRKLPSPSSSPAPKRFVREESPVSESRIPLSASGEPLEVFPGKSEQLSTAPLVVKQRVGQRHPSISALIQREQAVQLQIRLEDDETKTGKLKSSAIVLENISHGQLQVISVVPASHTGSSAVSSPGKQDDINPTDSVMRTAVDSSANQQLYPLTWARIQPEESREQHVTIIPTHAGWFAWDRVHKLERQALPQLFYGKSKLQSIEMYMQIRNAIIITYRQQPRKPLGLADISGLQGLDDKDLLRILEFLIHWGLVNYQAEPNLESTGSRYQPKVPAYLEEDVAGALHLLPLSLTQLESLYQHEALRAPAVASLASKTVPVNAEPSAGMAEAVVKEAHVPPQGLISGNCCSACATNCSQRYYYCEKQADFILCPDCFSDGRFGIGMATVDFILSDSGSEAVESSDSVNWTDQETLMLLEALESYGENWTEISEFVGTKSKAQCISHFIGLPIEDRFLEDMEVPRGFITAEGRITEPSDSSRLLHSEEHIQYLKSPESRLLAGSYKPEQMLGTKISTVGRPVTRLDGALVEELGIVEAGSISGERSKSDVLVAFAEAGNPVMALVAFLAAMVGPRVAAAAAHTALSSLSEDHQASQAAADMRDQNLSVASERGSNSTDVAVETSMGESSFGGTNYPIGKDGAKQEKNPETLQRLQEGRASLSRESMKKATAAALAAASVKAKLLADQEEREVQRLTAIMVDNQLKKLDFKLKQLGEIDPALEKDCEQIERNRQRLSAERNRFMGTRLGSASLPSQMPVSATPNSLNIKPAGPTSGSTVPATILAAAAAHSSGMLRPTLYTIGPGGMPVPVSASMVKPPS